MLIVDPCDNGRREAANAFLDDDLQTDKRKS